MRGSAFSNSILPLGVKSQIQYIVFAVQNLTKEQEWVIDFGGHLNGRLGTVIDLKVFAYDIDNKTKWSVIDTDKEEYKTILRGTSLSLNIGEKKKLYLVFTLKPDAGMPVTVAPGILSKKKYNESLTNPWSKERYFNFLFIR